MGFTPFHLSSMKSRSIAVALSGEAALNSVNRPADLYAHSAPWHGPIPILVLLLRSTMSLTRSLSIAYRISPAVTISHSHITANLLLLFFRTLYTLPPC